MAQRPATHLFRRPAGSGAWCRVVAFSCSLALTLVGIIAVSPSLAVAQTTTLSGTTTGTVSVDASTGTPSIVGNSVLTGTATFTYTGGAAAIGAVGTMTSNLSGTGALRFNSPATLVIAGTNTYAGGTSVTDGGLIEVTTGGSISHASSDLRVGVDGGAGSMTLSGGSVAIRAASIGSGQDVTSFLTVSSGTLTGSGALTVASTGANSVFQLDGGSVSSLSSTIGTGVSDIGNQDRSSGSALINGGTWTTTNGLVLGTAGGIGALTLAGGAVNSGSGTIGVEAGSNGTAVVSAGTWTNSGNLTVGGDGTGSLTIRNSGTVIVGGTLSLGDGGSIDLSSGGTLQIGNGGNAGEFDSNLANEGTLVFDRTGEYEHSSTISGGGVVVKEGSGTLTLSAGNSYTGGTSINDGVLVLGNAGAIGPDGTISFGGGTLRFTVDNLNDYSNRFNSSGNQQFKLDTNGENVTLASVIAGAGSSLVKSGEGTLSLEADNTYTGTTTVTEHTLRIAGSIAGDLVVQNNARVQFDRSGDTTYSGQISGTGDIVKLNANTLTLGGTNTYTGVTRIQSGTLEVGSSGALGSSGTISFEGGALRYSSANATDYSARFSTAPSQDVKIDTNGRDVTFAGDLSSAGGSLEKLGSGTLTLSGNNTYNGTTTLTAGTLSLGSGSALDGGGSIAFGGGTLQFTASNTTDYSTRFSTDANQAFKIDTNGQSVTFAGDIISGGGASSLAKIGSGTLALTGNNELSGGSISLEAGALEVGSLDALGGSGPIEFSGGTLRFSFANTTDYSDRFTNSGGQDFRIDTNYEQVVFSTALDGGNTLTKLGGGSLTLAADNTYTGTTTVSDGVLRIGDGTTFGSVAGDIVTNATVAFDRSDSVLYSGTISGSGGIVMEGSGTLILGGTNTYTGGTMLQGGVVSLASSGAIGASGPIEFNGGTLQYTGANTDDYSGRIVSVNSRPISIDTNGESVTYLTGLTGAGTTLEKLGAGTLTLSGSSSYDGGTTVGGGTLEVSASGVINHAGADLVVGGVDNGTLLVDGGQVSVLDANLGDVATTGTVRVEGGSFSSAGTVRIGNGSDAIGAFEVAGGTVTTAATVIGESGGTGSATVSGGTWTNSGNLDVNNGAPGTLTISGGTLAVGGTLTELSPNSIELQNGGELRIGTGGTGGSLDADLNFAGSLVFNRASASTYGRTLEGTGTLTKQGSGTLTLSAAGTYSYSGPTTVSAGGLVIDGTLDYSSVTVASGGLLGGAGSVANQVTVASGGVIDPGAAGDPGVLTIGTLTLQDGSRASFGILGDGNLAGTAGTDYDQLNVTGALTLSGTLRLDFSNPAAFAAGQEFELFNLVSLSGSPVSHFSEVIAAGTGVYTGLTFTRTADLWTSTLTAAGQSLRFSETTGKLVVVAVVPEPSTWGMLLAGGAAVVLVRGRRRFQKTLGM